MSPCPRQLALAAVMVVAAVLLAGCATHTRKMVDLRPRLAAAEYDRALALIDDKMGSKDAMLAALERGLMLHAAGRWQESNDAFTAAERLADELYGTSISESALALFTNDMARRTWRAPSSWPWCPTTAPSTTCTSATARRPWSRPARPASCSRATSTATIGAIDRGDTDALDRTRDDPFMLYFSGMLYDWDGELNDAFIAYRNAAVAYQDVAGLLGLQIPPWLAQDLERVSRRLGFRQRAGAAARGVPAGVRVADQAPTAGALREGRRASWCCWWRTAGWGPRARPS